MSNGEPSQSVQLLSSSAQGRVVARVLDDVYAYAKSVSSRMHAQFIAKISHNAVCAKVRQIRKVKTLFSMDRAIDLDTFYVPPKVLIDGSRVTISRLSDIPFEGNVIFLGTVGLGKSTFLRYLACAEASLGKTIPLFIELRKHTESPSFTAFLASQADEYGLRVNSTGMESLLKSGRFILFLDGFDEVPFDKRNTLLRELERVSNLYPATRIVLSSRPDTEAEASGCFRTVPLAELEGKEYAKLINKLLPNRRNASTLIGVFENGKLPMGDGVFTPPLFVTRLLTTPMMVTLVVIQYKLHGTVPRTISGLFQGLFSLILLQQDRTKTGFRRPRNSTLSDDELRGVFDAFCFFLLRQGISCMGRQQAVSLIEQHCKDVAIPCNPANVLDDIKQCTCLLAEEGGTIFIIHKSVQEFHAAHYVKMQPDDVATKFYNSMLLKWPSWKSVLCFLEEIDKSRFIKLFAIPDAARVAPLAQGISAGRLVLADFLATLPLLRVQCVEKGNRITVVHVDTVSDRLPGSMCGADICKIVLHTLSVGSRPRPRSRKLAAAVSQIATAAQSYLSHLQRDVILGSVGNATIYECDLDAELVSNPAGAMISVFMVLMHERYQRMIDYVRHVELRRSQFDV
jgi:hypothetical protein